MAPCLLQQFKTHNRSRASLILIFLVLQFCWGKEISHVTQPTQCALTFQLPELGDGSTHNQQLGMGEEEYIFKKCVKNVCRSFHLNGTCRFNQQFALEEEKCYRECCGSQKFDFIDCNDYNKVYQAKQKLSKGILITALAISTTGLLIATIIFAAKYLKCCKNHDTAKSDSDLDSLNKDNNFVNWKPCVFDSNYECELCKQTGAFVLLPCGRKYHLKCLSTGNWKCSHCEQRVKKAKVYCIGCMEYSIMVEGETGEVLESRLVESYSWHPHRCWEHIEEELGMETGRKFSETTNGYS